jgi:hypothetical protein
MHDAIWTTKQRYFNEWEGGAGQDFPATASP